MSQEDRVRSPKKYRGFRVKLRTSLRNAGLKGKMKTDIHRGSTHFIVWCDESEKELLPTEFEGLPVTWRPYR